MTVIFCAASARKVPIILNPPVHQGFSQGGTAGLDE
jgi:hypothetical protein